jgi:hypothetical protein
MHKTALFSKKKGGWSLKLTTHLPVVFKFWFVCSHNSTPTHAFMASTKITLCLQVTMCFYMNCKDMMEWLCSSDGADQIMWDYKSKQCKFVKIYQLQEKELDGRIT